MAYSVALGAAGEHVLPYIVPFPRGFAFGPDGRLFLASVIGPNGRTAQSSHSPPTEALSRSVSSQIPTHAKYGGVVPELASREHLRAIVPVVRLALQESSTRCARPSPTCPPTNWRR
jgi:hypothetical protein